MDLSQLHEQYGRQMIELELLQAQVRQTKQAIVEAMHAQPAPTTTRADGHTPAGDP
jgi:hypothetical protein